MEMNAALAVLRARYEEADHSYLSGDLEDAFNACASALQALDGIDGPPPPLASVYVLRADLFNLLGSISNDAGNFEQGRLCFGEAIALYARGSGDDDLLVHVARSNLAISLQSLGRPEESILELKAACEGFKRKLATEDRAPRELSRTLGTLGGVQTVAGMLADARQTLTEALQVSHSMGGRKVIKDVIVEAMHHSGLGNVHRADGEVMKSMSSLEIAASMLVPLWDEYSQQVRGALMAVLQNYDLSKTAAGIESDATVVATARALVRQSDSGG